ncbi:hypothetical protein LUX01_20180 [Streptomyces sudanensis]|nr:hypothetical protein [Streptomyces sudanensis]MCP9988647.1 hypothetical protein [Streptomyces sudanensis]
MNRKSPVPPADLLPAAPRNRPGGGGAAVADDTPAGPPRRTGRHTPFSAP